MYWQVKFMKVKNKAEVVIVGGGVSGCALAYYLAKTGVDVALIEREFLTRGATGCCPGGIRQQFGIERPELIKLVMGSVKIFKTLSEELKSDLEYTQKGYLFPIFTEEELVGYEENLRGQRSLGLDVRFLHPDDVKEHEPLLDVDGLGIIGANFCQEDGTGNPFKVTHAFAKVAKKFGASFYKYTVVEAIKEKKGKITSVKTSRGEIKTNIVVNAAGGNSRDIAKMLGVQLPNLPISEEEIISEPLKPIINTVTYARNLSPSLPGIFVHQTKSGEIIGSAKARLAKDTSSTLSFLNNTASRLIRYYPALKHVNALRTWTGVQDWTPDLLPILGPTDDVESFIQFNGLSGVGFMLAPQCAKLLAEIIVTGKPSTLSDVVESLNLRRFKGTEPLTYEKWASRPKARSPTLM